MFVCSKIDLFLGLACLQCNAVITIVGKFGNCTPSRVCYVETAGLDKLVIIKHLKTDLMTSVSTIVKYEIEVNFAPRRHI